MHVPNICYFIYNYLPNLQKKSLPYFIEVKVLIIYLIQKLIYSELLCIKSMKANLILKEK